MLLEHLDCSIDLDYLNLSTDSYIILNTLQQPFIPSSFSSIISFVKEKKSISFTRTLRQRFIFHSVVSDQNSILKKKLPRAKNRD